MPSHEEKCRRKQVIKNRRMSAEELTRWNLEFDHLVILKPEYYDLDEENTLSTNHGEQDSSARQTTKELSRATRKMLGDAGEHYALAKFGFLGIPCAKMPDNWPEYDFVLEVEGVLLKVAVKTRSETRSFSKSSWFGVDADAIIDWLVFIVAFNSGEIRSWVVPQDKCLEYATPKDKSTRHISWQQLENPELLIYRENWSLNRPDLT
jgi:hypothetical protein